MEVEYGLGPSRDTLPLREGLQYTPGTLKIINADRCQQCEGAAATQERGGGQKAAQSWREGSMHDRKGQGGRGRRREVCAKGGSDGRVMGKMALIGHKNQTGSLAS